MSALATPELGLAIPAGVPTRDGVYVCKRCHKVASPSQHEIDLAENAPWSSRVMLKCPHCRHRTVEWHAPTHPTTRDLRQAGVRKTPARASEEAAAAFFLEIRSVVN